MEQLKSAENTQETLPRNLLACLPYLWSRVLFPGRNGEAIPSAPDPTVDTKSFPIRTALLLLVLPAVLLYPCLSFHLFDPDEGRYAEIPREMLERGEWIVPYLQSEPYLDKPPLLYWLVMGSFAVFGVHDWSARIVPALAVHGTILLTYFFGKRTLGGRESLWGTLALALAPGYLGVARLLMMDGLLTFFTTLAIFSAFDAIRPRGGEHPCLPLPAAESSHKQDACGYGVNGGWWVLSAIACALAILTKGPVALILVLPVIWLYRKLNGNCCAISWRAHLAWSAIVLTIALPWFIAITVRLPEFGYYFLWEHNVTRFLFPFAHKEPVWFFFPVVFLSLLPVSTLLVPFVRFLLSERADIIEKRSAELGFMLLAGLWCVLFFSLSTCKLPTYVLPAYPFLCLAAGAFIARTHWQTAKLTRFGCVAAFLFAVVGNYVLVPAKALERSPMRNQDEVIAYCGDRRVPVVCYPRNVDSVAFYLGRNDLRSFRSKHTESLLEFLKTQDRTVVLFSHFHSLEQLRSLLPPPMRLIRPTKIGVYDMAIVVQERQYPEYGPTLAVGSPTLEAQARH